MYKCVCVYKAPEMNFFSLLTLAASIKLAHMLGINSLQTEQEAMNTLQCGPVECRTGIQSTPGLGGQMRAFVLHVHAPSLDLQYHVAPEHPQA